MATRDSVQERMHTAWRSMLSSWKLLVASMIVDLVFLFVVSYLLSVAFQFIGPSLQEMQDLIGKVDFSSVDVSLADPVQSRFAQAYTQMMTGIAMLFGSLFVVWMLLQGAAWYIAHRLCGTKVGVGFYAIRFGIVTVISCIGVIIISVCISNIGALISEVGLPVSNDFLGYLSLAGIMVVMFFCVAGYAGIMKLREWRDYGALVGSHWMRLMISYVMLMSIVLASNLLLSFALGVSIWLTYILILIFVLPAYTFARVLAIESVR